MPNPRPGVQWTCRQLRRRGQHATHMDSTECRARRETWRDEWADPYGMEPACPVCGGRRALRHGDLHWTHDRLGAKRLDYHVPLCRAHHTELHDLRDASPAWRRMDRSAASIGTNATLRRPESPVQQVESHDRTC